MANTFVVFANMFAVCGDVAHVIRHFWGEMLISIQSALAYCEHLGRQG